jgi:uncharacterized protein YukE
MRTRHECRMRYQSQSHQVLYNDLEAGVPEVIKGLAAEWAVMEQTLDGVTQALTADLTTLFGSWESPSGQEFDQRVQLVTGFSQELSTGMAQVSRGLDVMGDQLVQAKQEASQNTPDAADDPDKTIKATAIGFLTGGPAGAIAGGLLGHKMDEQEKEQARERIVDTVTDLATGYEAATESQWPKSAPKPPPNLPGKPSSTYDPDTDDASGSPAEDPNLTMNGENGQVSDPLAMGGGPSLGGVGAAPGLGGPGGNKGLSTALMIGAAVAGAAGLAGAIRGAPDMSAAAGAGKMGAGSMMGGMPGAGVGGVLGKDDRGTRGGGRAGGGPLGSGTGAGGSGSGAGGRGDRSGMVGNRGANGEEEDEDERTTWLTEDEMPWTGQVPPPPVLGAEE